MSAGDYAAVFIPLGLIGTFLLGLLFNALTRPPRRRR